MSWWSKKSHPVAGSVLFRGALPPRADDVARLKDLGCSLRAESAGEDAHWIVHASHPTWGDARIVCLRDPPMPPALLVDHDQRLTQAEKGLARLGRSSIGVLQDGGSNVLVQRKRLLRYLHAVGGTDAVVAVDHTAQAMWSAPALADELAHDAELDVLALFTVHMLSRDDESAYWMHTHGLSELGFFDFDVLEPSLDITSAWDVLRALAFGVVEGTMTVDGEPVTAVAGASPVQMVDAQRFLDSSGGGFPDWKATVDPGHLAKHAIVCEPAAKRFFGLKRAPARPWPLLSQQSFDDVPILFSDEATDLMARRARATWSVFRAIGEELTALELPSLVKLCYETTEGRREHLWFTVNRTLDDGVDATLMNDPWGDVGMKKGDARVHGLERLTDWTIFSPAGPITPRSMTPVRSIRDHWDEIVAMMREERAKEGG